MSAMDLKPLVLFFPGTWQLRKKMEVIKFNSRYIMRANSTENATAVTLYKRGSDENATAVTLCVGQKR